MIGYYDPMGLADLDLWGQGEEASIGARALDRAIHTLHARLLRRCSHSSGPMRGGTRG